MSHRSSKSGSSDPGRTERLGIVAIAVLVVCLAGLVALDRSPSTSSAAAVRRQPIDGPTIPGADSLSVAWYCAEGTSDANGRATETVIVGNLARHPIDASITVMVDGATDPPQTRSRVPALGQLRVPVSRVLAAAEPGVVVEVRGGSAVVEHEIVDAGDIAVSPCARTPSARWYFAGGSTERGAQDRLALFNPFGDDAIVDVSFLTSSGFQAPGATQGVVVPRRSRVSLPIHEQVVRQERVAVLVKARVGRVVAERSQRFDGTDSRQGIAMSLGATGTTRRWWVPFGQNDPGTTQSLFLADFATLPTRAEVRILLDGGATLPAQKVAIPARGVVQFDVAKPVPAGTGYGVEVRVTGHAPIAVESFGSWASPAPVTGVAAAGANVARARRWAFALGRLDVAGDSVISALNTSSRPVTVQLYAYSAGDPQSPRSAPAAALGPGERATFIASEVGLLPDQVVVVEANGPIVVGRTLLGSGASLAAGVPGRR